MFEIRARFLFLNQSSLNRNLSIRPHGFIELLLFHCLLFRYEVIPRFYLCDSLLSCVDPEVRHSNTVESVLYFIRRKHSILNTLVTFAVRLDPRMFVLSSFHYIVKSQMVYISVWNQRKILCLNQSSLDRDSSIFCLLQKD